LEGRKGLGFTHCQPFERRRLTYGRVGVQAALKLSLYCRLDVLGRDMLRKSPVKNENTQQNQSIPPHLILGKDLEQLLVGLGAQNVNEQRLILAPLALRDVEQGRCISRRRLLVNNRALVTCALQQLQAQPLEVVFCGVLHMLLQRFAVQMDISLGDFLDSRIADCVQNVHDRLLVGFQAGDGVVQLLGVELDAWNHQRGNGGLEIARQVRFQLVEQLLAVFVLEQSGDFQPLVGAATTQDLDDRLFVGAGAFECLAQICRIVGRAERIGRVQGWNVLKNITMSCRYWPKSLPRLDNSP
jgi:hypothetical protein